MKRLLVLGLVWGCGGTVQNVRETPPVPLVCDLSDPAVGLMFQRDHRDGQPVQDRVDINGDGEFDVVMDYERVDATRTDIKSMGFLIGTITRSGDQEILEMQAPPSRMVTYFDGRLPVRIEVDQMAGGASGVDAQVDSVRILSYEGGQLMGERVESGGLLTETVQHIYENGRRVRSVRNVTHPTPLVTVLDYTYDDGRCLATLSYPSGV